MAPWVIPRRRRHLRLGEAASSFEDGLLIARPKLAKRLARDATPELQRFVAKGLDGIFKATEKFIDFTMAHLPAPPAVRPPEGFRLDWARMAEHLELVYAWRSRDLHDGTCGCQKVGRGC
jgi:hypothetical protein